MIQRLMPRANPEERKEYAQQYYQANRAEIISKSQETYKKVSVERRREIARNSYHRHKERYNAARREKRLKQKQYGECPICHKEADLVYDHCHATGEFRDYICTHCNLLLGHAFDTETTLENAKRYLQQHRSKA